MPTRNILVDATPILDRSGHRGIGRYVYDLLQGLEATRDEWRSSLNIRAVTHLGFHGEGSTTSELAVAADLVRGQRGSLQDSIRWRRRLSLGSVSHGADVLHLTEAVGTPLIRGTRWGVTCYDLIPLRMPEQYLGGSRYKIARRKATDRRRYCRADALVAISERTRLDMIDLLQIAPEKVTTVPTGIDLSHWLREASEQDREMRARGGAGERPYVLFVGEGDHRKGIATMMRALAAARRSADVELIWVGRLPPNNLARFKEQAAEAGVTDAVRFAGFVADEDLAALYRGALAMIFLSVLEGFGLPVAEALAASCPVIVVENSGSDEVAGDAGYVVSAGDHEAAGRAIVELAGNPEERARRVRLGQARVPRYDRKQMARGYVEVWQRMTAKRTA